MSDRRQEGLLGFGGDFDFECLAQNWIVGAKGIFGHCVTGEQANFMNIERFRIENKFSVSGWILKRKNDGSIDNLSLKVRGELDIEMSHAHFRWLRKRRWRFLDDHNGQQLIQERSAHQFSAASFVIPKPLNDRTSLLHF